PTSPEIADFINGISPTLNVVVVCAVWFGVSIPLLVLLFYTSNKETRRTPLFIANAVALLFAMSLGLTNVILLMKSVLNPSIAINRTSVLAFIFILMMVEIFIDSILLFRVFIVYPPARTPLRRVILVFGPLLAFKIGRIVNAIIFMVLFARETKSIEQSTEFGTITLERPEPKIGWCLQIADNMICSAIFLTRLRGVQSRSLRVGGEDGRAPFGERLRILFWIALSNFVFPAMVTIALLVLNCVDRNYTHFLLVFISNIFVEAFGVLFATIWSS
ncbi:hypothetical protein BT96DRAFT_761514, partial [Gymnopus androsaceus JB14]